jgi:hypothetical protein
MKHGSPPSGVPSAVSFQGEWPQPVEAWREQLVQCARKPSRRRVHALRSLTLRLRMLLEHRLQTPELEPAAARAFKRWKKEVKKLRRMLEPVRDADVYLAQLDRLRKASEAADGKLKLNARCRREMDKLEKQLQRRRQAGADKLMIILDARGRRLARLSQEMETALTPRMLARPDATAPAAMRIFSGLMKEFPRLDSSNLHGYRKSLKPALYLAEFSAAHDPLARRLATAFRKMHLAAGEWHDWQSLTLEARRVLPAAGRPEGLLALLEGLTEESLQKALRLCRRSMAQFLKSAAARRGQKFPANP